MAKTIVIRRHKPDTPDLSHIAEPLRHLAVRVSSLHEDPSNARLHDEANLAAVETSLRRFGQRLPLVVQRQGMVVRAGNARLAVAARLGWTHVAAIVVDEGDADAVAFAISDNRTAEMGRWDEAALGRLLKFAAEQVSVAPAELSPIGFTPEEIDRLVSVAAIAAAPATGADPDAVPATPKKPRTARGDVWEMGPHRLMCGDSADTRDVDTLMAGARADMVWTDPPYGVDYVGKTADALVIQNDTAEGLAELLNGVFPQLVRCTKPGSPWYVAAPAGPQFSEFAAVLSKLGVWRQTLVWVKDSMVLGHSDFHYRHEAVFYGWTPGARHRAPESRSLTTVWEFARPKASEDHPTMKPVALVARAVELSSPPRPLGPRPLRGLGYDPRGGRAARAARLPDGAGARVLRRDRPPLGVPDRQEGQGPPTPRGPGRLKSGTGGLTPPPGPGPMSLAAAGNTAPAAKDSSHEDPYLNPRPYRGTPASRASGGARPTDAQRDGACRGVSRPVQQAQAGGRNHRGGPRRRVEDRRQDAPGDHQRRHHPRDTREGEVRPVQEGGPRPLRRGKGGLTWGPPSSGSATACSST